MARSLSEEDWDSILKRIHKGNCTPFLGAGASADHIGVATEIAQQWARQYAYPLPDMTDLMRVAQFRAVKQDDVHPKEDIAGLCRNAKLPDFRDIYEVHRVLADLPLKTYITTNYDDFMVRALEKAGKNPRQEICGWNEHVRKYCDSIFESDPKFNPDDRNPLVFHLHGCAHEPMSMVLTEDDYVDFLLRFACEWQNERLLPSAIRRALSATSLLFIGYSRNDWTFRVLFRGLVGMIAASQGMKSVAVQLTPLPQGTPEEMLRKAEEYLEEYYRKTQRIPVCVYWGTAAKFAHELRDRYKAYVDAHEPA